MTSLREIVTSELKKWNGACLYAVIDAAQDYEFAVAAARDHNSPIRTLFEGNAIHTMAHVAPYAVAIDLESQLIDEWAMRWGTNLGIFLISNSNFEQIHMHLRDAFIVVDDSGQEYFFRFYDPRVVRQFVKGCPPIDFKNFMKSISALLVEGEEAATCEIYNESPQPTSTVDISLDTTTN